jgi:plasmid replication initiation protein
MTDSGAIKQAGSVAPLRSAPVGDGQLELFEGAFVDIAFRDQQDLMENPLCSLAKGKRIKKITYQAGDKFVEVTANAEYGMATIYDHDILMWAATQVREAADRGLPTSRRIVFHPYSLLKAIRRGTGGREYKLLREALDRLKGTTIKTNIRLDDGPPDVNRSRKKSASLTFGLLEAWGEIKHENPDDDCWCLAMPEWMYRGVLNHKLVLSIDPDYFLLESGMDRFLYRVFRKHAGFQETGWAFTMRQLYKKSGSADRFANFATRVRRAIKRATELNHVPGYVFELSKNGDGEEVIAATSRAKLGSDHPAYVPRLPVRRRVGLGFNKRPKFDNRARAQLLRKLPAPIVLEDDDPLP